jgi:hypothetical protein
MKILETYESAYFEGEWIVAVEDDEDFTDDRDDEYHGDTYYRATFDHEPTATEIQDEWDRLAHGRFFNI